MRRMLFGLILWGSITTGAYADPILTIDGAQNQQLVLLGDGAATVAFTFTSAFNNVAFAASLDCRGCNALAWLTTGLDAGFDPSGIVEVDSIGTGPLFSGLTLGPGTYFLTIQNSAGVLIWNGTTAPTVTAHPDVSHIAQFETDDSEAIGPASRFNVYNAASLVYSIDADVTASVPEPSTLMLLAGGLGAWAMRARRRRG